MVALSPRLNNTSSYSNWIYNQAYNAVIVKNKKRNELIVDIAERCIAEGNGPVVILVKKVGTTVSKGGKTSISHAALIQEITSDRGIDFPILHGGLSKAEQESILQGVSDSSIKGIIASEKLLGVGISIKSLAYLILGLAGSNDKDLIQRVGRMLRIYEGKSRPQIYDFIDNQSWFKSQSAKRMETLRATYKDVEIK